MGGNRSGADRWCARCALCLLPSEASQVYTRLDAGLARVGNPCEKGTTLKLEVNFHNTICGDVAFHGCLGGKAGVVREGVVEKNIV